jgi:hypothetical protein
MSELAGWDNFYVIMGSSAGALIGLQFVVMTLIADISVGPGAEQAASAFGTPTVVHFGAVLLLAGVQCAPWPSITSLAIVWAVFGAAGLIYITLVLRRMRSQERYRPEFEDWLFHAILPFVAYGTLAGAAGLGLESERQALFAVAAAVLLLLFVGIHNAWDAVTYHVYTQRQRRRPSESLSDTSEN